MPRVAIIVALVVLVMLSGAASAKPKVAVAPIKGDSGGEIADAIAELLGDGVRVVKPADTEKAMDKLGVTDVDDKSAKKLLASLKADAIVSGKLEKKGKKKSLKLTVRAKGKDASTKTIPYKSISALRDDNKDDVAALVSDLGAGAGDEDEDKPKKRAPDPDEDKPKKKIVAREERDGGDGGGDGDDGEKKIRKKKKHDDDDKPARSVGPAFRADAGLGYGLRRLTYDSSSSNAPPTTGTAAPSAVVTAEVFPFNGGKGGGAAGFGVYGGYAKALGLSISIPGTAQSVPVDQQHYWFGARYRFPIGETAAMGLGVGYDRRQYVANRVNLVNPSQLDTPDTDYASVAPDVWLTAQLASKVMFVAQVDGLLLLSSGAITTSAQFGHATAYGVALDAGIDIAVSDQFVLRLATEASQVSFSFTKMNRGVSAANDRSVGLVAALAVVY